MPHFCNNSNCRVLLFRVTEDETCCPGCAQEGIPISHFSCDDKTMDITIKGQLGVENK